MMPSLRLSPLALLLALPPGDPQAALVTRPIVNARMTSPAAQAKAVLLPPGKTQGTFHLNGLVRPGKSIILRWANTHGEMPTEGVTVYRMRMDERHPDWKPLNRKPVMFFRGDKARDRLKAMNPESRNRLKAIFHSDLHYDPATRTRKVGQPAQGSGEKVGDLTPEKVAEQFVKQRQGGRLSKSDMLALHTRADSDPEMAEVMGLSYTDTPGKGQYRYKIVVKLPEGGTAEAVCAKTFDASVPTPVPLVINLSTQSGNGKVLLNWDVPPSDVVTGYHVYRAETAAGPWRKLTRGPVKVLKMEAGDPELGMQKALARGAAVEKEMRRNPGVAMTPSKVREIQASAHEAAAMPGALPALGPALSGSIRDGVKSGRVPGSGPVSPLSLYSDDRKAAGNGDLQNDRPYVYRVTTVDIAGFETALETAPLVTGTPKDLEPPKVPGRPMLKAESEALAKLRSAQTVRSQDPTLKDLNQALRAKLPMPTRDLAPLLGPTGAPIPVASPAPPAPPAYLASTGLGDLKRMRASRLLATFPSLELEAAAKAARLVSGADGSIPPAQLTWEASPDPDLKSYEVYRATGKGPLAKVGTTLTPGWTDTGLEIGQSYRYAITALDQRGNESDPSGEGVVEVCDGQLKGKLAIAGLGGQATTAELMAGPGRKLMRPAGWVMKAGDLKLLKATAAPMTLKGGPILAGGVAGVAGKPGVAGMAGVVGGYKAPTSAKAPTATGPKGLGAGPAMKGVAVTSVKMDATAFKALPPLMATPRAKANLVNVMLVEPEHPKEIHVQLEWARPTAGHPTEYVIYQAAQKMVWKSLPRASAPFSSAFTSRVGGTTTLTLSPGALAAMGTAPTEVTTFKMGAVPPAAGAPAPKGMVVTSTPELHKLVDQRRAALPGAGLKEAPGRKDHKASLLASGGPGEFTRVNDKPVTGEHYTVTFPADVAQYGGASFYYRVQALTLEFGRVVEGPLSEPIEVRLPDVVPPPPPETQALDLQEGSPERFNVAISWSPVTSKDFAGCVVDRQPLDFTVADGEVKPGAPIGTAERRTPKPLTVDPLAGPNAFTDANVPSGYLRYSIRSVDATGNVSEPKGALDVWVPGETRPEAPKGLALAGNRLTWAGAANARGYSVWRSFTGADEDYEQISPLLEATELGFNLPAEGTLHLKVVARSASGMHQTASEALVRTP